MSPVPPRASHSRHRHDRALPADAPRLQAKWLLLQSYFLQRIGAAFVARKEYALLVLLALSCQSHNANAAGDFDYQLQAVAIAEHTYLVPGTTEDFSMSNGGNIVNTAFVVTDAGVVLIDTGPSVRYARQLASVIADITPLPVLAAIITHHHPDHWFGNQFYSHIPIYALPETIEAMVLEGDNFADNLYRMSGDWMRSTQPVAANAPVPVPSLVVGNHDFQLIPLEGHTVADLAVLDTTTGVLFTGDLAFDQRTPTTPHANLARWQASLNTLGDLEFSLLVPGHGPTDTDGRAIAFTRRYLTWLEQLLEQSARTGASPTEVMQAEIPAAFSDAGVVREELARSVVHLYGPYEQGTLQTVKSGGYN